MNRTFLSLVASALAGAAAAATIVRWSQAAAALSPQLAPTWMRASPGLLLAVAAGAWLASWRARRATRPGARPGATLAARWQGAAGWLVLAAAAVLLADPLGGLVAPAIPPPVAGPFDPAGWLPVAPALLLLAGGLVLLAEARLASARRPASAPSDPGASRARHFGAVFAAAVAGALCVDPLALLRGQGWSTPLVALLAAAGGLVAWLAAGGPSSAGFGADAADAADTADTADDGGPPASGEPVDATPRGALATTFSALIGGAACVGGVLALMRVQRMAGPDDLAASFEAARALGVGVGAGALACALRPTRRAWAGFAAGGWMLLLGLAIWQAGFVAESWATDTQSAGPWLAWVQFVPPGLIASLLLGAAVSAGGAGQALGWFAAGGALGVLGLAMRLAPSDRPVTAPTLVLVAAITAVTGLVVAVLPARGARGASGRALLGSGAIVLGLAAWALPLANLPTRWLPGDARPLGRLETPRGVVDLVERQDGSSAIRVDGAALPGADLSNLQLRRAGRLAAAMRPGARTAAMLMRGTGDLLAALAATSPAQVILAEPDAALLQLAPKLAFEPGQGARGGPVQVAFEDPRAFLLRRRGAFDLVVGNLPSPGAPGAGESLTREHFLALRGALAPDGVAVQWFPLQSMPWPAFASAARAFLAAFPDARALVATPRADEPLVALVGGLARGLPGPAELDALLGAAPSVAGPNGAPDVYDLYLADAWALERALEDDPPSTLEHPLAMLLSLRREGDEAFIARTNLRQLAALAVPLETSSLRSRPLEDKEVRRLGAELTARSAALVSLLVARAASIERRSAAPGGLSAERADALDREQDRALLFGWSAAPGHLDVRDALVERANDLLGDGRRESADALLGESLATLGDPLLAGVQGGLLLRAGDVDGALARLLPARAAAPKDRTVLANLAAALLLDGRDIEALGVLQDAREAFAPRPLPPLHAAALALLEGQPGSRAAAEEVVAGLPRGEAWREAFERLLALRPEGG